MCLTLKVKKFYLLRGIIEPLAAIPLLKRSFTLIELSLKFFVSFFTYLFNMSNDKLNTHLNKP